MALAEMRRLMPKAAERLWEMMNPYLDPAHRAAFIDGLRKAVASFYGDGPLPSIEEVRVIGARFAPFQNLTAHYLLTGLRVVGA